MMDLLLQTLQATRDAPLTAEAYAHWREQAERAFESARLMQHDRDATFPQEAVDWLNQQGAALLYLPSQHRGRLTGLEQISTLWRALAALDLTVAIGHGKSFLGAVSVWLAGNARQVEQIRRALLADEALAWGLTERGRGADLMATRTTAVKHAQGWRLQGEKWLINNATRGNIITLLARTDELAGARGMSVLLLDKRHLPATRWRNLPKVSTYGIRGADISGQQWQDAELPDDALVGEPGQGLEITLRALQLTRTACCGLSVGALDAGLRLTTGLVQHHRLYGRRLSELDTVQTLLAESQVVSWMLEITAWTAARHASYLPQEMSVVSALAKAAIPSLAAHQLSLLEEQMGARGFVSDLFADGAFQKLIRDHQIVPIFDGSTLVSRSSLAPQLPTLIRQYRRGASDSAALDRLGNRHSPTPAELPLNALTIYSRSGCSLVQALPAMIARAQQQHAGQVAAQDLAGLLDALLLANHRVIDDLASAPVVYPQVPQQTLLGLQRYESLFIAASCLLFWLNNPAPSTLRCRHWLPLCLTLVARQLGLPETAEPHVAWQALKASFADRPFTSADAILQQGTDHER